MLCAWILDLLSNMCLLFKHCIHASKSCFPACFESVSASRDQKSGVATLQVVWCNYTLLTSCWTLFAFLRNDNHALCHKWHQINSLLHCLVSCFSKFTKCVRNLQCLADDTPFSQHICNQDHTAQSWIRYLTVFFVLPIVILPSTYPGNDISDTSGCHCQFDNSWRLYWYRLGCECKNEKQEKPW